MMCSVLDSGIRSSETFNVEFQTNDIFDDPELFVSSNDSFILFPKLKRAARLSMVALSTGGTPFEYSDTELLFW